MEFVVQDAQREKLIGAINIMGPSGSGKTYASLVLAFGMMKASRPNRRRALAESGIFRYRTPSSIDIC